MDHPFDTTGLNSADIESFQETYRALKDKYGIETTGYIDFRLDDFELLKSYEDFNLRESFAIRYHNNDCYILFTDTTSLEMGKHGGTRTNECQTWALAYLKKDLGRVLIRRETLADKLVELIHPVELDFDEDKAFSDTWYVLVNDVQKAKNGIDRSFRNAVMDNRHEDFIIEVVGHTLIVGNRRAMSPERAVHMADFVVRVCSMC